MLITDRSKLELFYSDHRVWQLVPTIERTKNGRLFCTFYSGVSSETLGNYCVVVKSDDDGKTWTEPIAVAYDGEMHRCFDPVLWLDPIGRMWFTWSRGHEDGVYGAICDDPDADILEWSDEFFIGHNVMMNKPTVLSTGEWLFPMAIWNFWHINNMFKQKRPYHELHVDKYYNNDRALSGANVYCSIDNGKSLSMIGGCRNIRNRCYDEHMIYEKTNGVLVMLIRTDANIARSYSYDRGRTWTDAEDSGIENPSSRFHVKRLKSGRLLLINHYDFNGRNNLTAFLSEDDGKTWPYKVLIDARDKISYPDVTEGEDGYIYIVYDRERGGFMDSFEETKKYAREILIRKINETDIINGEIKSSESYDPRIVSKLGEYKGKADYYTEFPVISCDEFVNTVMNYDDIEIVLENLFVYYSDNFLNMTEENAKKIDEVLEKIKLCFTDNTNLKQYLKNAIDILELSVLTHENGKKAELVDNVIDFLNVNLEHKLDIKSFAQSKSISAYYLCHIFKKQTQTDIYKYRDNCRFTKSKQLLVTTDLDLIEICKIIGIHSVSCYVGDFVKRENITPDQYRQYNKIHM